MSTAEEIKAMQRRLFTEFFSQGKLEVADEIFAPTTSTTIPTPLKEYVVRKA